MEETKIAVDSQGAAPETVTSTVTETEDMEARFKKLEEEKNNYKTAFLKEKSKNKSENFEVDEDVITQKVQEALANSRLAEIAREQDAIIQKALKENKELKLAQLNKTTTATAVGTHSEGQAVKDTLVTPEQMAYFKSKNWSDKEIERYKKNFLKNSGR